jgi:hypothetical protein
MIGQIIRLERREVGGDGRDARIAGLLILRRWHGVTKPSDVPGFSAGPIKREKKKGNRREKREAKPVTRVSVSECEEQESRCFSPSPVRQHLNRHLQTRSCHGLAFYLTDIDNEKSMWEKHRLSRSVTQMIAAAAALSIRIGESRLIATCDRNVRKVHTGYRLREER